MAFPNIGRTINQRTVTGTSGSRVWKQRAGFGVNAELICSRHETSTYLTHGRWVQFYTVHLVEEEPLPLNTYAAGLHTPRHHTNLPHIKLIHATEELLSSGRDVGRKTFDSLEIIELDGFIAVNNELFSNHRLLSQLHLNQ